MIPLARIAAAGLAAAGLLLAASAHAQTAAPTYTNDQGKKDHTQGVVIVQPDGGVTGPAEPLPVSGTVTVTGGATSANQTSQITQETTAATNSGTIATNTGTTATNTGQLHTDNGAAATGITQPTGGSGVLGWLSGIYKAVTGTLTVQQLPFSSSSVTDISPTNVGVTSAVVDTAQTRRSYLMFHNPSALGGAYVSCDFGPTAVLNGSGTITIYPGQYVTWEGTAVPNAAIACIASAAATPFTVYVLEQ